MSQAAAEKLDIDHLRQWIGKTTDASDIVTAQLVKGLRATLFQEIGEPKPGDAAPWTVHWCLAQPVFPMSQLSQDGQTVSGTTEAVVMNRDGNVMATIPGGTYSGVRLSPEIPADFYDFQKVP